MNVYFKIHVYLIPVTTSQSHVWLHKLYNWKSATKMTSNHEVACLLYEDDAENLYFNYNVTNIQHKCEAGLPHVLI